MTLKGGNRVHIQLQYAFKFDTQVKQ
jgi:hypothetical protein